MQQVCNNEEISFAFEVKERDTEKKVTMDDSTLILEYELLGQGIKNCTASMNLR